MTTTFSMDQFLAISRVLAASEAECAALRGECESLGFALAKARSDKNRLTRLLAAADARAGGKARLAKPERGKARYHKVSRLSYCLLRHSPCYTCMRYAELTKSFGFIVMNLTASSGRKSSSV